MKKQEKQKLTAEIKDLRVKVDGITQLVQAIDFNLQDPNCEVDPSNPRRSRELNITITKLQEGKMWLGKLLQGLGAENPYPSSMDSSNETIEPPADIAPNKDKKYIFNFLEPRSHIKSVKQLRQWIEDIISSDIFSNKTINNIDRVAEKSGRLLIMSSWLNAYSYLVEAKMWLGMELGRIREENEGKSV